MAPAAMPDMAADMAQADAQTPCGHPCDDQGAPQKKSDASCLQACATMSGVVAMLPVPVSVPAAIALAADHFQVPSKAPARHSPSRLERPPKAIA